MVTLEDALRRLREGGKPGCLYFDPHVMQLETIQSKIESSELMKGRIIITSEVDLATMIKTKGKVQNRRFTVMRFAEDYETIESLSSFDTMDEAIAFAKLKGEGG